MNKCKQIKAVSFDIDMTLLDFETVMRNSLSITLAQLRKRKPGKLADELTVDSLIEIRDSVADEFKGRVLDLREIRRIAFDRTVRLVGGDDSLADELFTLYIAHRHDDVELFSDARPILDSLRGSYRLGVITNGNGWPERMGLAGYFEFAVFSQDVGIDKPAARIFHVACDQANCEPGEIIHVGDSLESDVAGANDIGMISVWLNRDGCDNDTGIIPDYEIRSLGELSVIL